MAVESRRAAGRAQRRQHREHELLGALPQEPDRLARGVAIDHAAGRRHGVAVTPASSSACVLTHTVWKEKSRRTTGWSGDTASRSCRVGSRAGSARISSSSARFHPLPRIHSPGAAPATAWRHERDDVRDRRDRREADVERQRRERETRGEPVHMRVIDPGQRRPALEVDHGRAAARQAPDLARRAGAPDPAAADREGLGDAVAAVERVHLAVEQDEVGRLGLRRARRRCREGQRLGRGGAGAEQGAARAGVSGRCGSVTGPPDSNDASWPAATRPARSGQVSTGGNAGRCVKALS